ncbi:MAG: DMT family transporter [Mycobacteriales bacterium]
MTVISVLAALAAALCFAGTSVVQHVVVAGVPQHPALSWPFLRALLRKPWWLASQALDVAGVLLQAIALRYGPVLLVQPLIALGLVFAVPLRDVVGRRLPRRRPLLAAAAACAGVGVLVVMLEPAQTGRVRGPWTAGTAYVVVLAAVVVGAGAAHRKRRGTGRSAILAATGGAMLGAAVVAMKPVVTAVPHIGTVLTSWPVYAMVPCALAGVMLSQSALQTSSLTLPLTLQTLVEPIVAALGGVLLLGERIGAGTGRAVAAGIALAVAAAAIVALARWHAVDDARASGARTGRPGRLIDRTDQPETGSGHNQRLGSG